MYLVRLLCLASSQKLGGRCIAGLDLHDKNDWVRPVSASPDGTLRWIHCASEEGRWPEIGEVWTLSVTEHVPKPWQPENWRIGRSAWEYEGDLEETDYLDLMEEAVSDRSGLFGTTGDRINADVCRSRPRGESLVLIDPDELQWEIKTSLRGNRQLRARFRHAASAYNLVVTDIAWRERLRHLPVGVHPRSAAGIDDDEPLWLTVSLSEPADFDDCCYKLVAAVIGAP